MVKCEGKEMLSIVYETPIVRTLSGYIVERRVFFTTQGLAVVDVICKFTNPEEKGKCLALTKHISNSISISG
ncbi:hypothetical protein DF182_11515 [Chitinophaga flava]|uniref:Uncharacterized protein n=1 Tax=Chitinophaga flava TaxID=2259036 RepID=A0A365Y3I8_9BACT|nr:hypothetical protein DF182_11515 [Chitinophaga flava]